MPTEAKRATVAELKEEIAGTHAAIVADYRGLSVGELRVIRRSLREHGVSYRVVKNRLAKIAAQEAGREELVGLLDGPTGLASVISAPLRNLGYALSQVAAQKEANTPSA